jgi:hypothetical protein
MGFMAVLSGLAGKKTVKHRVGQAAQQPGDTLHGPGNQIGRAHV